MKHKRTVTMRYCFHVFSVIQHILSSPKQQHSSTLSFYSLGCMPFSKNLLISEQTYIYIYISRSILGSKLSTSDPEPFSRQNIQYPHFLSSLHHHDDTIEVTTNARPCSLIFYWTTRRHIPEDRNLRTHLSQNLQSTTSYNSSSLHYNLSIMTAHSEH